jgi:hypothetical protein
MSLLDPSTWRLFITNGGNRIPYKLVEGFPKITYERENASADEEYIIRASDLTDFVSVCLPPVTTWDENLAWQSSRALPGNGSLRTKTISVVPFEEGKPADPYNSDQAIFGVRDAPPSSTYAQFLRVSIKYTTGKDKQPDENDPTTFLEVSADATGEFLMLPMRGDSTWGGRTDQPVSGVSTPASQVIPEIDWTVRWPYIPATFIPQLLPQMRSHLGKVNSAAMPVLYDADVETILFAGFSLQEQYTWRNGEIDKPPVELEFKFLEKHIEIDGEVIGHNHFWREEVGGFEVLNLPDGSKVYREADLNQMWAPQVGKGIGVNL